MAEEKSNPLQAFAAGVLIKVITDPGVQEAGRKLVADTVTPLIPLVSAAAGAAVGAEFKKMFGGILGKADDILESDPDLPFLSNVFDLSETIRGALNQHPNINIPILGDFLKGFGGQ